MDELLINSFEELLKGAITTDIVRQIQDGDIAQKNKLEALLDETGYMNLMVSESHGGAALNLKDVYPLFELIGKYLVPVPLAAAILGKGIESRIDEIVPSSGLVFGQSKAIDPIIFKAMIDVSQMAGVMLKVLEMSIQYVNERVQFGKPIGKYQAIQHQISVMAEQVLAARVSARQAFEVETLIPRNIQVAIAKAKCSEAANTVCSVSHAVHGAIGFTKEFDLQLYTTQLNDWRIDGYSESYWYEYIAKEFMQTGGSSLDFIRQIEG